jgi:uncharacterized protein DUF1844
MSPSEPPQEESFKVTDRRRRVDTEEEEATAPPARPEPPRAAAARPEPPRPEPPRAAPRGQEPARSPEAPERNLSGLFVMLASSAAMAMGEAPDPVTGQVQRDLPQAAELIDLLALLREKTEGNRTAEETQILDEILYDLQLRYVAATRRPGQARGPSRS